MRSQSLAVRIAWMMIVTSVVGAAVGALGIFWTTTSVVEPLEFDLRSGALQGQAERLSSDVLAVEQDVGLLRDHQATRALLEAHQSGGPLPEPARAELGRVFQALLGAKARYLQVRLIGPLPEGRELIRWELSPTSAAPVGVVGEHLQTKGDREYVRATLAHPPGELEVSPIELNQERGQVQVPHVPVVRVSAPIHGAQGGAAIGMVVINVDMRAVLQGLVPHDQVSQLYVVRIPDGSYLAGPDSATTFGSELGLANRFQLDHPSLTWAVERPRGWAGRLEDGDSLAIVAPVDVRGRTRAALVELAPLGAATAIQRSKFATLLVGVGMAVFSGLVALLLGRSIVRPLAQMAHAVRGYTPSEPVTLVQGESREMDALVRAFQTMQSTVRERTTRLQGQREAFRRLVDDAPIAMLVLDDKHEIQLANRVSVQLFGEPGAPPAALEGTPVATIVPAFAVAFGGNGPDQDPAPPATIEGRGGDGALLMLAVSVSSIAPDDESRQRFVVSLVDVTLRERAAAELVRSNEALQEFAYLASHDLQEPLRMMAGYADLLQHHYATELDERGAKFLDHIGDGARRMRGLITGLLSYSRVASGRHQPVPMSTEAVVREVLEVLAEPIAENHATVELGALPRVMGDPVLLAQVFQNLLVNALKFRRDVPPKITIAAQRVGASVRFCVSDNGIGIPAEAKDRVFQMFQRLHPVGGYEGSGIGLAFARRIVERHGGTIWCESEPDVGTQFFFTLPAASREET